MWLRFLSLIPALALAACSPLSAFDTLVPKDAGSALAAHDQAFADGARGKLDIYVPTGPASSRPRPVMLFIYGGSWNSGNKRSYEFAGRALASKGFVVAVADYRLVPQVRYPAFLEDSASAFRWLRANAGRFGGDPDRLVIVGHSAGAYNAAMLALDPHWLKEDREALKGFVGLAGPYDFLPLDTKVTIAAFQDVADLAETQPINFASSDDPPALLLAGGKDDLVFPSQSVRLAMLLSEAGARAETRIYPDIGHVGIAGALARPLRSRAPVLDDIAAFAHRVTAQ